MVAQNNDVPCGLLHELETADVDLLREMVRPIEVLICAQTSQLCHVDYGVHEPGRQDARNGYQTRRRDTLRLAQHARMVAQLDGGFPAAGPRTRAALSCWRLPPTPKSTGACSGRSVPRGAMRFAAPPSGRVLFRTATGCCDWSGRSWSSSMTGRPSAGGISVWVAGYA